MRIYLPIAILIVALAGYFWLWQSSAQEVEVQLTRWIEDERAAGRRLDHSGLRVHGFPYRLQIDLRDVHYADAAAGWSWEVDRLTGFVLPYRLNHAVVVADGNQRLAFPRLGRIEVISGIAEDQRASFVFRGRSLERFAMECEAITARRDIYQRDNPDAPERSEDLVVGQLNLHSRRVPNSSGLPDTGRHYAVQLDAETITWDGHPYEGLGSNIAFVLLRMMAAGLPDAPSAVLSADLLQRWHANEGVLFLDEAAIQWSEIEVGGTGVFELDEEHRLTGDVTVLITGHDRAIDALVAAGALAPEYAQIAKTGLDVVAALGGDPAGRIRAPMRLENGRVYLGPAEMMELEPLY